jgi:hypothetical protein
MARLVAEMLEKNNRRVWLDQREMKRTITSEQVIRQIAEIFLWVPRVIILAAPGDWRRFTDADDIHRWEWELSLQSGKAQQVYSRSLEGEAGHLLGFLDKEIWLLQYGWPDEMALPLSKGELATSLMAYDPQLAGLLRKRKIQIQLLTLENIDGVLKEIAEIGTVPNGYEKFFLTVGESALP